MKLQGQKSDVSHVITGLTDEKHKQLPLKHHLNKAQTFVQYFFLKTPIWRIQFFCGHTSLVSIFYQLVIKTHKEQNHDFNETAEMTIK